MAVVGKANLDKARVQVFPTQNNTNLLTARKKDAAKNKSIRFRQENKQWAKTMK